MSVRPARYSLDSNRRFKPSQVVLRRGGRNRFSVVDGKTSVLDSTDSSSVSIAISGLLLVCRRSPTISKTSEYLGSYTKCHVNRVTNGGQIIFHSKKANWM